LNPREIAWSLAAVRDVAEIVAWIAEDNPEAARRWAERVNRHVERAAELPYSGRKVPEFDRPLLREMLFSNYRLVYEVTDSHIIVIRVFEGHRELRTEHLDALE
jgi:plasmid stabilization system protein ParE